MSKVLVTGDCGFLGGAVAVRLMAAGHDVLALDPLPARNKDWPHLIDDLSDMARLLQILHDEKVSHVIHTGGVSGPMVLPDEPAKVVGINVGGSLNLLQASLKTGVTTFVYCSSVSALGDFYERQPVGSDFPLRPLNTYGCSKAAMDMVLRGLWKRVPLDLCSLRFTSVYGPGRRTSLIIDEIVNAALHDQAVSVEPTSDWPFIYIDDAADAAVAACFSRERKELYYFISHPEQVSLERIIDAAAECGTRPHVSVDTSRPQVRRGPLDIGPARRDFGFAPKVGHRAGIAAMIAARRASQA
jgi:nucleoside-diphosphate-sugar epimerase